MPMMRQKNNSHATAWYLRNGNRREVLDPILDIVVRLGELVAVAQNDSTAIGIDGRPDLQLVLKVELGDTGARLETVG